MHESVLQNKIHMLETALRGKNQEVQICSALEKTLENRQDKIHARKLKQTAQRHLQMLFKVYQYYKGDAAALLSEKAFLISDFGETAAAMRVIRQETDPVYATFWNISNFRIRKCLRSIQEEEKRSIQWYQRIAADSKDAFTQCEDAEKELSLVCAGNRQGYVRMLNCTKNIADMICPNFFETDKYGNLIVSSGWESGLEYFIKEAHQRKLQVVPIVLIKFDGMQNWEKIGMQLARAVKQYHLDGINIDTNNLLKQNTGNFSNFIWDIRKQMRYEKTVAVTVTLTKPITDDGLFAFSQYADYIIILPKTTVPVKEVFSKLDVSANKIFMGIFHCGQYSKMGDAAERADISEEDIQRLLERYITAVRFDPLIMQMNATVIIREWDPPLKTCDGKILTPGVYDIWYDTSETVQYKMEFARRENLCGIAVWK